MQSRLTEALVAALVIGGLAWVVVRPRDCPDGKCPPAGPSTPLVQPTPTPNQPQPTKPKRPWLLEGEAPVGVNAPQARVIGQEEPAVDLLAMPAELRKRNIAARGLGCCVFRSAEYGSWWQNCPQLAGFPEWMVSKGIAGGGYPSKLAKLITQISQDRGMPEPAYIQYEGNDPTIIELALRTGRVPCITWDGNHMLCGTYLDQSRGAILDNNYPDRVQWYSRAEFLRRWRAGGGGWVFCLLNPGPPPPPRSRTPLQREPAEHDDIPPGGVQNNYRWEPSTLTPGAYSLWDERGKQVGFWNGKEYLPLVAGKFGKPCDPPIDPPGREIYGVEQWVRRHNVYEVNGREVSREQAIDVLLEGSLIDDSTLPHLTVIGPEADRQRVLTDLETHPALAAWKGRFRVQSYAPQDWAVTGFGFVTSGTPTIYVQTVDGEPLLRIDEYPGPVAFAGKLRRADPLYRPDNDPNGQPTTPVNLPDLLADDKTPAALAALIAALVVYMRGGRNRVAS